MKHLARWAMQSRSNAIIAAAICFALPMFFWCGAALLALVVLRQGLEKSGAVIMWASLPTLIWLALGDPLPLMSALGVVAMAITLRQTVRLDLTMLTAIVVGVAIFFMLPLLIPEVLKLVADSAWQLVTQLMSDQLQTIEEHQDQIYSLIQGVLAAIYLLVIVLSLLLGRYWQSALFNPQGFGREFKQLRMPVAYSVIAMLLLMSITSLTPELAGIAPILTVPMMLAGLALLHGVASKKAGSGWMVFVYVALIIFGPYMYTLLIFLALFDSLFNFRARIKDTV